MDMSTVSIMIAIAGCFVGLAGWLSGRDKKISNDSEWKGTVNAKLDSILSVSGTQGERIEDLAKQVEEQGKTVAAMDQSIRSAHQRIDTLEGKK